MAASISMTIVLFGDKILVDLCFTMIYKLTKVYINDT